MFSEAEFRASMARSGFTQERLANEIGITATTLYRKMKRGGDFSRSEINSIIDVLGIDQPEQVAMIFFAPEVTET